MWTIFKKSLLNFYNAASTLCSEFFWLRGMWVLTSQPGIEPLPPALEGEVLTTGLPGKSLSFFGFVFVSLFVFKWDSKLVAHMEQVSKVKTEINLISILQSLNIGHSLCSYLIEWIFSNKLPANLLQPQNTSGRQSSRQGPSVSYLWPVTVFL